MSACVASTPFAFTRTHMELEYILISPYSTASSLSLLVFQYGGGILENQKTLGTRLLMALSESKYMSGDHFFLTLD